MREVLVIGIGPGDPDQITVQAIKALNTAQVVFVIDKGQATASLLAVRAEIIRRHVSDPDALRIVEIAEPPRDRAAERYAAAVQDWHQRRAELLAAAIADELPEAGGVGAFLVWGDPSVYDSTLRVIDWIRALGTMDFDYRVIPGVTSVQALAAAHRQPLNRIGEPIHVTTGRRLREAGALPASLDSAVIMLDAGFAAEALPDDTEIYWGAYLSTPDEVIIAGRLGEVGAEIARTKRELRARHGWIMDSYLVRRPRSDEGDA